MDIIRVESLTRRLGRFKLGPVDLQVAQGEILGIMGPKGAGKSTLLRILWGFARPDSGTVSVFDQAPHLHQVSIRLRAGYLSETRRFYEWMTARQFLTFVSGFYENWDSSHVNSLLEEFEIDTTQIVWRLSKSHRTKLAFVAALGHRPDLLLLDEPTQELEPIARQEILMLMKKLASQDGTAIVAATDNSENLNHIPTRVVTMCEGQLA